MELKEFITNAIVDVMQGVKDAQEKCSELGGIVNPKKSSMGHAYSPDTEIRFNIALSESSKTENGRDGGIGVHLGFIDVNGEKGNTKGREESSDTRIGFSVMVKLPAGD